MKLLELHIYGYGKIINKQYKLSDLQLFFGENETGKSTIMSFIHSILFGFPTKQHSLLRYEPKFSGEYGGKVICEMDNYGLVQIERIKGKASGDVTVQFEDGRVEGEEALRQLLGNLDRTTYQNIFSFNLEGLQNIQRLKKEDLNRYLFSAGSTGTDLLLQMDQDWQKERERLFKKSGRKPMINTVLTELKSLEKQVREGKEKNERFSLLIEKQQALKAQISSMEEETASLREERENLISVNENWNTLIGFARMEQRMLQLEEVVFPPRGLEHFNELKTEERQVSAYLETLKEKQGNLQKKIESAEIDKTLREDIPFLEKILSHQSFYLKWKEESSERDSELKAVRNKINGTIRELGLTVDFTDVPKLDTSMMMSDNIQQALDKHSKLLHERESLQNLYEEAKEELYLIESKCDRLEERLMEEDEYQQLQRSVKAKSSKQASRDQADWVNLQVKRGEERFIRKKASFTRQLLAMSVSLLLLSGLSIWAVVSGNWLFSGISLMILIVVGTLLIQAKGHLHEEFSMLQEIKSRAEELKPEGQMDVHSIEKDEENLKTQMELRHEWKQRILSLEEQQLKLEKVKGKQNRMEREMILSEERLSHLRSELSLPNDFHWKWLPDAHVKMKEAVTAFERSIQLEEEQASLFDKMKEYREDCQSWFHRHSLTFTTVEDALVRLKGIMQELEKRQMIISSAQSELEPLSFEINKLSIEREKVRDDLQALMESAGCEKEGDFRQKALQAEERSDLAAEYSGLKTRLTKRTLDTFKEFDSLEESRRKVKQVSEKIDGLTAELSTRQKELASISYERKVLEEGKSYSSILQEFHGKKAELQELAYEWSKYTLAQVSLSKTIDLYQKTKMPEVMRLAEEIFRELTENHYHRILLQEDEMIKVKTDNGEVFNAVELSQGTKEQLYIALRFALIQSFRDKYPLPILIDDGVVNFDRERTTAFLKLLRKMSINHQILFFTCHPHIKDAFHDEEVIVLKRHDEVSMRTS
ncbi:AAA family ATPase [Bacillus sp. RO3]|nr:AAA family ATPase [Bacillus sp. RO3]